MRSPAEVERLRAAMSTYESATGGAAGAPGGYLRRIPVRRREDIVILSVDRIASVVADGELLHVTTTDGERHTITYRLKDLEARLAPHTFVRLSRGALARIGAIQRVRARTGGLYVATLSNGQQLPISRIRSRVVRDSLLKL
jgi:two-component system LytT family response regulator